MGNIDINISLNQTKIENIKHQRNNIWVSLIAAFGGLGAVVQNLNYPINIVLLLSDIFLIWVLFLLLKDSNKEINLLIKNIEDLSQ